jgi:RNA polymerase sigma factor (TIGR02999 family)
VPTSPAEITRLLGALASGDPEAMDRLLPFVYEELKVLAARYLRHERSDHTLTPTGLVHEAYLKLVDQRSVDWEGRSHFFGIAAQAMRRILVDHARRRIAKKRGRQHQVTLDTAADLPGPAPEEEVAAVDEALTRLAAIDPRQGRLVELRYFAGLSIEEAAEVLGVSPATVKRDWALARAWLQRELRTEP